ncbi:MAG: methyltransferase [Pirellulaceae bacterium]
MEVRPQEQRLIQFAAELPAGRILCNTLGRAQLALALAKAHAQSQVACFSLDLYQVQQSQLAGTPLPGNLRFVCDSDPPPDEIDLAAWCFSKQGDAELTRDLLQASHQHLAIGGRMAAAIDNPADQWLHEQLRGMFDKVTRRPEPGTTLYLATKTRPLKKIKDFTSEFAFRDAGRPIDLRTRPGVFSHREVDGGARALIKAMDIQPGLRVLDLGSGSGAVGIAAALRAEGVRVQATDSNPRAIEAVRWGAERNGVSTLTAALDCDGSSLDPGTFDLVLANPPYFSNFSLAGLFATIAHRALAPRGTLLVVTKTPDWYRAALAKRFDPIATREAGSYQIVQATRL